MNTGIFISYNHGDARIALALNQSLLALSPDLNVFIDHSGLEAGDEYEAKLARSIGASQWFLIICSGSPRPERDMGWCLYEAGQFRQKLFNDKNESLVRNRIVAIHDGAKPKQLSQFQSVLISELDQRGRPLDLRPNIEDNNSFENTPAYSLFETIIKRSGEKPLRDLGDSNVRNLMRESVRKIVRAFIDAASEETLPEIVLQPRISFRLPPTIDRKPVSLSPDTKILSYEASLSTIFGINGVETTWNEIKLRCQNSSGTDPFWMTEVERAAEQVSLDHVPEQPIGIAISKSDGKFYRVLFARYEPTKNKARTCYVAFVPTRARRFDVRQRTSILLSTLILSIRFKQRILPYIERIKAAPQSKMLEEVLRFDNELSQVETEAQEFGLFPPEDEGDETPLLGILKESESKQFIETLINSWKAGRAAFGIAINRARPSATNTPTQATTSEAATIIIDELQKVGLVNSRFIQIISAEILEAEKIGIGSEAIAVR